MLFDRRPKKSEDARRELVDFVNTNTVVSYALLRTGDGLDIASHPSGGNNTQRLAAMSSSLQALATAFVHEAGLTGSRNLIIESPEGAVVVMGLKVVQSGLSLAVVGKG